MEPGAFQISLKVFLVHDDAFLVLRERSTGRGDLPGGRLAHAEFYEPWSRCITRELREELGSEVGFTLHEEPLFVFPHFIVSAGRDALGVAYRADYHGGAIQLSEEHDAHAWVSIRAYDPDAFFTPHVAAAIRRFQELTILD